MGGSFSAVMPMVTDSQGQASTSYTLPKKSKTVTITCTSTGFVTGTFSEVAVAGPVSRGIIVSGNSQTGLAGTQLPAALVMQVLDPFSFGVPGVLVTFSDGGAGGTFTVPAVTTDSTGQASTFYTTPNNPGTVTITASTTGITPVKFSEVGTTTAPAFTLSATPDTFVVAQGSNITSTITVVPTGGFAGMVSLAASGLPSGVTASFNPTSTASTSTLTLTATSSATAGGPTTVTVTGASGNLTPATTISLTVTPPAPTYSLSASAPSPASVSPGGSSTVPLTVTSGNNYAGTVTLYCSIAPVVSPPPTCSFGNTNPVTVTSGGGTAMLTFSTTGPSGAMVRSSSTFYALWLPIPGLVLIGLGCSGGSRRYRKKLIGFLFLWMVLASLIVVSACGSGGNGGGGGGASGGTPAGNYIITVTGRDANNLTQSNSAPTVIVTVK